MKVLIVGGTGLTGAHAALYLRDAGHEVTLMSRSTPAVDSPLAGFAHRAADYVADELGADGLGGFDALVFCAGLDIRGVPPGADAEALYHAANTLAIPRFFAAAKAAGIRRAVLVGSFYPHIVPHRIETDAYVRSRYLSREGALALSDENFSACCLDAPFIIGHVPGLPVGHLAALALFGAGQLGGVPKLAPDGGMNFIASASMSEAIAGALVRGVAGRAYLVGDENLSWKACLELFCAAAGNPQELPVSGDEHPLLPDAILFAGRNATVYYEPDNGELGYSRGRVQEAVQEVVDAALGAAPAFS